MYFRIVLLMMILSFSTYGDSFSVTGKFRKGKVSGQQAFISKQFSLLTNTQAFPKGSDVELAFQYLDKDTGDMMITYTSSDPLDEDLNTNSRIRIADGIYLKDTGKLIDHKVILRDVDFTQQKLGYNIKIQSKKSPSTFTSVSLRLVEKTAEKRSKSDKLNVLMIVIDDLNDYIGAFGDPQAITSNIDKLVSQGVRFNRAYCQYPVCGPSRASFLSGQYPESSGVLDNTAYLRSVNPSAVNLFEHFRKNGYWTGGAGKLFHGKFGMYEKGVSFDEYQKPDNAANPQNLLLKERFLAEGGKGDLASYIRKNRVNDQGEQVLFHATSLNDDQHGDGRSARKVAQWILDNEAGDKPFMMACGIVKPHVPFYAPKKYFDLYPKNKLTFENVPEDDWSNKPKIAAVKSYLRFRSELGVNNRQVRGEYLQAYLACISFMDAQVKVLLDALEKSGKAENTVVVFFSDHGFHIGEHFMYGKVTLFEESTRVPFSIRLPGAKANGKTTDSFTELIDVYPTLVELCGLPEPPHNLQGKSLVRVLQDPEKSVRDSSYTVVTRKDKLGRTVRTDKWRFTHWGSDKDIELYNMQDDFEQYNNLSKSPEYKEVVKEMIKLVKTKEVEAKN